MLKEKQIAVAVCEGYDLFLCHRIRRSPEGDVYHMTVTGRDEQEWKKWNPHESHHKNGRFRSKSFDHKSFSQRRQVPDSNFRSTECFPRQGIDADRARAFGIRCDRTKFDDVIAIPAERLRAQAGQTDLAIDLTEPGGPPILPQGARILAQHRFDDAVPEILVTVFSYTWPGTGN